MPRKYRTHSDWRSQMAVAGSLIGLAVIGGIAIDRPRSRYHQHCD